MEFDEIVVKESPGLCRCCLSEGCYKDLGTEYVWMDDTEVYADMLLECFDIGISQHMEGPNGPNRLICEVCITRLRDACNFKKQVLDSEQKFIDMVGRGDFKNKAVYQDQLKCEITLEGQPVNTDVEFLDEDVDYDDPPNNDEPTVSEDITVSTLPIKSKRGRPKKTVVKEKKKTKTEEKAKAKVKGAIESERVKKRTSKNQLSKPSLKILRKNTVVVLENSTVMPFIWLRTCYRCFYCYEMFLELATLRVHQGTHTVKDIHESMAKFHESLVIVDTSEVSCKICFQNLTDIFELVDHLVTVHEIGFDKEVGVNMAPIKLDEGTKCVFCSMVFKTVSHVVVHMSRYHKGCLKSLCCICGTHFRSYNDFCDHAKKDLLEDNIKCSECGMYLNYGVLRTHMKDVHGMRYKCLSCFEFFTTHYKRSNHMADVHNRRDRVKCSYCSRSFIFQSILMRHVRENHLKLKNVVCEVCGWRTYGKHELENHMAKHDSVRHVRCPVCDKAFKTIKYMKKHCLKAHK